MSAGDFQTKYSSVMESMLKSAIAETTKLFETMVDELRTEISRVKEENEDLKTRCSQFESATRQATVHSTDSDASEKRDVAVQCDLAPVRMMLVEQCQPLRRTLQNQKQQCGHEKIDYTLLDHNYETQEKGISKMAFAPVEQESVRGHKDVGSTVVCEPVLSDKADSPRVSACGIENEGPFINKMPEEPKDSQEKALSSSENSEVLPNSGCLQPSKQSEVSTTAIIMTEPKAVSVPTGESTSHLDKELISIAAQDCEIHDEQPIEEKQSADLQRPTSIISKDMSDPHLQMTKTQFLAQLAVSPVTQDVKTASSHDSVDARASPAETSTRGNNRVQQKSLMAQLRNHIQSHLQARGTETNPEPHTEAETCNERLVKARGNHPETRNHSNDKNTAGEPIPLSPKTPGVVEDVTSLKKTPNDPSPISLRRPGLSKDGVKSTGTVGESSFISSRRSKATIESTPVSPSRSSSGVDSGGSRTKKSSQRTSRSTKEHATSTITKNSYVHLTRASLSRDGASLKSATSGGSPNNNKTTSVRPKRSSLSRERGTSPKNTECSSLSPRTSGVSKTNITSKTNEATSAHHKGRTSPGSTSEQIKRKSDSISCRRLSTTTDGDDTKINTESTSVKKPRLITDHTSPKKNIRVVNAKKLTKAAKAKTIAKIKISNKSKLQNGAKTVWTPPRLPASKTPPAGEHSAGHVTVRGGTRSQDHTVVYPPSVSLQPIPVKAQPAISPLQPLSVIGRRLLKNQCGECGRVLSSSAALESHVSLHTGRRPFSCTLCGKRFPDSKGLKRHGRVHRNGRIHICQQCGKGFVYRFSLTKHVQMVHGRIKPFVCQICNKGFFTKRDVEAHIRIHTGEKPFHCNLCEKKFTRRVELNVHLRWHNGEKRHWCPYCGKGFLDFNNLKRHKYTHTGEKPHSCPHCPKNFTQSGHLKKHVRCVHKIQ